MNLLKRKRPAPEYRPLDLGPGAKREPLKVHDHAVAASRMKPAAGPSTWVLPKPFPGVVPPRSSGRKGLAMDEMSGIGALYAFANLSFFREGLGFMGFPYLAELTQRGEYRRISEIIAKEMTRKWIKLTHTGATAGKDRKLKKLEKALKKYNVQRLFQKIAEHDGWFGSAHLYPEFVNPNTARLDSDDPQELETLLLMNPAKIPKGSLKNFKVVEPWWCYPGMFNAQDPLKEDFYKLKHWYVMGKRVHASRLLTFVSREVPDMLKPMYQFGGISMSQIAKPYVDNWLETRQGINDIVQAFSVFVLKTNMSALLEGGGLGAAQYVGNRLDVFNNYRDNKGVLAVDFDTEDFLNVSAPIAGLHELQAQSQEHVCSITGIPLIVYTGITPSGLNASSEGEIATWNIWVNSQQEHLFRPGLTDVIKIIQLSEFGFIDPDIDFDFVPLWDEKKKDKLDAEEQKSRIDKAYVDMGAISGEEVRERLTADEESLYTEVDLTAPAPEPPEQGGFPPGETDPDADPDEDEPPKPSPEGKNDA